MMIQISTSNNARINVRRNSIANKNIEGYKNCVKD